LISLDTNSALRSLDTNSFLSIYFYWLNEQNELIRLDANSVLIS
jgi:hypothetical protein